MGAGSDFTVAVAEDRALFTDWEGESNAELEGRLTHLSPVHSLRERRIASEGYVCFTLIVT
jgi:hypothetical protein